MSLFKAINPVFLLGTGIIVFLIGVALWSGKIFARASLFYLVGGFAVIVWAVAMRKRKGVVVSAK